MNDPTTPAPEAAAPPPAPSPIAPAAPPVAVTPAPAAVPSAPAVEARRLNPYAGKPAAPPAPATPSAAAAADPRVDGLMEAFCATVAQTRDALPANVIAAVRAMAPDTDPVAQSKAINALRANGLATAPTAPASPLPMPSTTTAGAGAPPPAPIEPTGDAAVLAQFQAMKSRGAHITAASFYAANSGAIERALKTATN